MLYTDSSRNEPMFRNQNGEEVLHKETVRVYRNLRDGCWSIQRKIPGKGCLLYTSPSPRDLSTSRMPSSA